MLTLRAGAWTTGRRSSPVPQLQCVGGSGAGRGLEPSDVQCYNRGSDGIGIQWQCKADLEATVNFGKIEVNCEGYDYPEDDFVLVGSCGLKYKLKLTMEGRTKLPAKTATEQNSNSDIDDGEVVGLVILILIVVACIIIPGVKYGRNRNRNRDRNTNRNRNRGVITYNLTNEDANDSPSSSGTRTASGFGGTTRR